MVGGLPLFAPLPPPLLPPLAAWPGTAAASTSAAKSATRAVTRHRADRCKRELLCMTRHSPGNPAIRVSRGPEALRPRLATGLPLIELCGEFVPIPDGRQTRQRDAVHETGQFVRAVAARSGVLARTVVQAQPFTVNAATQMRDLLPARGIFLLAVG